MKMKSKFELALAVSTLTKEGYEIYYENSNDELIVEKDGMISTFKSEAKFQSWINEKLNK